MNPNAPHQHASLPLTKVVVTDVDISFGQMVNLMVKFAVASIPAALILAFVGFAIGMVFTAIGAILF